MLSSACLLHEPKTGAQLLNESSLAEPLIRWSWSCSLCLQSRLGLSKVSVSDTLWIQIRQILIAFSVADVPLPMALIYVLDSHFRWKYTALCTYISFWNLPDCCATLFLSFNQTVMQLLTANFYPNSISQRNFLCVQCNTNGWNKINLPTPQDHMK